jgi:hypothetical protein
MSKNPKYIVVEEVFDADPLHYGPFDSPHDANEFIHKHRPVLLAADLSESQFELFVVPLLSGERP